MTMKAKPLSAGMEPKKRLRASMPPADAPMPTTGQPGWFLSAEDESVFRVNSMLHGNASDFDIKRLLTGFRGPEQHFSNWSNRNAETPRMADRTCYVLMR